MDRPDFTKKTFSVFSFCLDRLKTLHKALHAETVASSAKITHFSSKSCIRYDVLRQSAISTFRHFDVEVKIADSLKNTRFHSRTRSCLLDKTENGDELNRSIVSFIIVRSILSIIIVRCTPSVIS